ncbi:MAG: single-stranded DNA-binding protein [Chloroflexi bacterium HGW-Chloroflexi-3]|nr:MAG: single-stranded DNA-binding protein [Chloroflexi bacterium HGW-Chloroflexi-3]
MASLNRVQLIGRVGREPESKNTANDKHLCTFTLAVERRWKDKVGEIKKETDWFNMEAWSKTAEICEKYAQKGRLVFIEGQLRTQRYESNGETKYFTKTIIDNIQFLDWHEEEPETDVVEENQ